MKGPRPGQFSAPAIARIVLGVLMAVTVVILALTPKPWDFVSVQAFKDVVAVYLWWAALINLVPLGLLAITAPWWLRALPAALPGFTVTYPRGFGAVVFGAMLVCGVLGGLRLNDSLWDDELHIVRRSIVGRYTLKDDGAPRLRRAPWSYTIWYDSRPANHNLQTILSRLSLGAWQAVVPSHGLAFSEIPLRLPSYLAGVLSIGVLALLVARLGWPWAGALAAWLLALHPWHLRLTPEARGYGLVMLLVPLMVLFALRAIDEGKWRWWLALAAAEFAFLFTWIPGIMLVLVLNVGVGLRLATARELRSSRPVLVPRWLATQTMAGIVFTQLFLPCVPQLAAYLDDVQGFASHSAWLGNVGSFFLTGSLWSKTLQRVTPYEEYLPHATAHPGIFYAAIGLAVAFLVVGVWRLGRRGARVAWLIPVFLLPGPLMYGLAALQQKFLFEWYLAFMLPGLIVLVALGACGVIARGPRLLGPALAVLLLGGFTFFTQPTRAFLLSHSVESYRESVLLTRPTLDFTDPRNRNIITGETIHGPEIYDPLVRHLRTMDDYRPVMQEADERGASFYVNNAYLGSLRIKHPDIAALLEDPAVFEHVATLHGVEEMLDREVFHYRPGGRKNADFARYEQLRVDALLPSRDED